MCKINDGEKLDILSFENGNYPGKRPAQFEGKTKSGRDILIHCRQYIKIFLYDSKLEYTDDQLLLKITPEQYPSVDFGIINFETLLNILMREKPDLFELSI